MATVEVQVAGERASATFSVPSKGPVVGQKSPDFVAPAGALGATPATLRSVLNAAPAGSTVVCRGGVYPVNFTISKAVTIQRYPGEEVIFDGGNSASWLTIKAPVTWRGIHFRNFNAGSVTGWLEYGLMIPTGGGGTMFEQCRFSGFKGSAWKDPRSCINFFSLTGSFTVRSCTFEAASQGHIYVARCESLLIEQNLFLDANQDGQQMEPVTASVKVSPSSGNTAKSVVIRNNIVDGSNNAAGIWLDTDVLYPLIYNNTVTRCGDTGIFVEACVNPTIFSNRSTGGGKPLRVLITPGARVWNNEASGGEWGIEIRQDERRNTYAPTVALGSTWITVNTEVVNNDFGSYTKFQLDTMDDGPKTATATKPAYTPTQAAEDMIRRIEGNRMPRGTRGTQIGWGNRSRERKYLTIEQLEAQYPGIARNNAVTKSVGLPSDLAALAGVPAGTVGTGPLMPAPMR